MATVNLVPLGLGELLDQTFSTFRKHFWLFAGIMALPEGLMVGLGIILQVYLSRFAPPQGAPPPQAAAQSAAYALRVGLVSMATLIPHFIIYAMALGATTYALSEVYLGRTVTIRDSYRVVMSRLWRLIKVIFAIIIRAWGILGVGAGVLGIVIASMALVPKSLIWVMVLMVLIAVIALGVVGILAVIFVMRYSVAVPALMLERLSTRQALKRSVALTKGYLWRLLVVGGLMSLITLTLVSLCQAPFTIVSVLMAAKGARAGLWIIIPSTLVGGVGAAATSPLLMISFAIAYYDLRVRKEGFDLQLMMSNLDRTTPPGATSQGQITEVDRLEDASVLGTVLLSFLTGGIYQAFWLLTRRKALNNLHSPEKLGMGGPAVALAALIANFCLPIVGTIKWGSWVEAENTLTPAHASIVLLAGIILVVQCFKVRRILLDHLAPQDDGMFSASVRFQYDELLSRMGTFFLGIFYLQYKINGLLDRLRPDEGAQGEMSSRVSPVSPLAPVNL